VKKIKLSKGVTALIDDADYEKVNQFKWYCNQRGYAVRNVKKNGKWTTESMHRMITDAVSGISTDHINGEKSDNRRRNLRICTISQNGMNRHSISGKSKYKGVSWHRRAKKWQAQIKGNGKPMYLGTFDEEREAAKKYDEYAKKYFGEFACLNFS
jgi:hypothetical protein